MIVKNRQEAINVVAHAIWHYPNHNFLNVYDKAYELAEYALRQIVWEEPEQKRGKWIDHSDDGYVECPFCRSATNCDDNINELHYCFSCGAKMEVEDD